MTHLCPAGEEAPLPEAALGTAVVLSPPADSPARLAGTASGELHSPATAETGALAFKIVRGSDYQLHAAVLLIRAESDKAFIDSLRTRLGDGDAVVNL